MADLVKLLLGWVVAALAAAFACNFALGCFSKKLVISRLTRLTFVLMLSKQDGGGGDAGRLEVVVNPDM